MHRTQSLEGPTVKSGARNTIFTGQKTAHIGVVNGAKCIGPSGLEGPTWGLWGQRAIFTEGAQIGKLCM